MERRQFIIGAGATALGATAVGPTAAEAAETGRAAGWNSNFSTNNLGWSRVSGAWYRSGGMWRADGLPGYWTSTKHTNVYENFVYQAKVKRDGNGGGYYNNSLVIRGNPASLNSAYEWSPSYIFGFTNTRARPRSGVSTTTAPRRRSWAGPTSPSSPAWCGRT